MDLSAEPWAVLPPIIPAPPRRSAGRGRPWREAREGLHGIPWILRTGAPWQDLPERSPPDQTCHRRLQPWVRSRVFERLLQALAADLWERGGLDLSACGIDGTLAVAKQGGAVRERPGGAKVRGAWPWQTVLASLSPFTWRVLRRTRSPLLTQLSPSVLAMADLSG
jgi:transposase